MRDIQAQFDEKMFYAQGNENGILISDSDVARYKECIELDASRFGRLETMLQSDEMAWRRVVKSSKQLVESIKTKIITL